MIDRYAFTIPISREMFILLVPKISGKQSHRMVRMI